jgi:hypothetical protein
MQNVQQYLAERKELKQGRLIVAFWVSLAVVYYGAHFIIYLLK